MVAFAGIGGTSASTVVHGGDDGFGMEGDVCPSGVRGDVNPRVDGNGLPGGKFGTASGHGPSGGMASPENGIEGVLDTMATAAGMGSGVLEVTTGARRDG